MEGEALHGFIYSILSASKGGLPSPPILHVTLNLRVVNYLTQEVSLLFIGKRLGPCACVKYLFHGNDFALISESDFLERIRISEGTGRK